MMPLPPDFLFSQKSLQDYVDCERRFELRYIQRIKWPAIPSEPALELEQQMFLGQQYHLLIQRDINGIHRQILSEQANSLGIADIWENYLKVDPVKDLPGRRFTEFQLTTTLAGRRILAQYDLLAVSPEACFIVDWKTSNKLTSAATLLKRMQTIVYPLILIEAGKSINNGIPIVPEQVQVIYWFANFPTNPVFIQYSENKWREDRNYITGLISEICARGEEKFSLTEDEQKCRFCSYRTLCARDVKPGDWRTQDDDEREGKEPDLRMDFEQIGEIEF